MKSLRVVEKLLADAFFAPISTASPSVLDCVLASQRAVSSIRTAEIVPREEALDLVVDLPEAILRAVPVPLAREATLAAEAAGRWRLGAEPLSPLLTERDLFDFFRNMWLPQLSAITGADVAVADLSLSVSTFRQFIDGIALDRGRFHIHSPHGVWVPSTRPEQDACASVLHWMSDTSSRLRSEYNGTSTAVQQQQQCLPQWKVLHVGSSGGFITDALLKSGARQLLAVDHSAAGQLATEGLIASHIAARRSTAAGLVCEVGRARLLPKLLPKKAKEATPKGSSGMQHSTSKGARVGHVASKAAAERRRRGRAHRNGPAIESDAFDSLNLDGISDHHDAPRTSQDDSELLQRADFTSVVISLPPLSPPPLSPRDALQYHMIQSHIAPYANHQALKEAASSAPQFTAEASAAWLMLLAPDAYSWESVAATQRHGTSDSDSPLPKDVFVSAAPAAFDVCHEVRHACHASDKAADAYVQSPAFVKTAKRWLGGNPPPAQLASFQRQARSLVMQQCGLTLTVLERRHHASIGDDRKQTRRDLNVNSQPAWKDTFEYENYLPKTGPVNSDHWSQLVPNFAHLDEVDAADTNEMSAATPQQRAKLLRQRNDASAAIAVSKTALAVNEEAARRFGDLFADDLRQKRQRLGRKLAFASATRKDWFLDEKLAKSEASRVEVLNELLKRMGDTRQAE